MTNSISPVSSTLPPAPEAGNAAAPKPVSASEAGSAPENEAVTLSAGARATTQLLNAARDADGVNQNSVAQIRGALQNGSYNVSAEDLAQAIATVLKETN
jgi:flagellar biosynthesis anti-sigma factor FlgM